VDLKSRPEMPKQIESDYAAETMADNHKRFARGSVRNGRVYGSEDASRYWPRRILVTSTIKVDKHIAKKPSKFGVQRIPGPAQKFRGSEVACPIYRSTNEADSRVFDLRSSSGQP